MSDDVKDLVPVEPSGDLMERVLIHGSLGKLTSADRVNYYLRVCKSLGLNPMTRPFDYILLDGKLTLYAKRDCAEQLRKLHGVTILAMHQREENGVYIVHVVGRDREGRYDQAIGAIAVQGMNAGARALALMKCETKAKRRLTLSICGLGMMDESEAADVPAAVVGVVAERKAEEIEAEATADPDRISDKMLQTIRARLDAAKVTQDSLQKYLTAEFGVGEVEALAPSDANRLLVWVQRQLAETRKE